MRTFISENTKWVSLILFSGIYTILNISSVDHFFTWDTIQLASKHAHWYHDNEFSELLLPGNMDSGHIPFFGFYLASLWKLFGKSLLVSHLAVLPFMLGIIWQSVLLLKKFIPREFLLPAMAIFLLDPTLLSQSTLVSPDIPLVFFFLMGLNCLLNNKRDLYMVAILGLFLVSMRGMMTAFGLLLVDLFKNAEWTGFRHTVKQLVRMSLSYLPAVFIFLLYNVYHYHEKGWVIYHQDSPWASSFDKVSIMGVLFNLGLLGWRFIDLGRVFVWLPALVLLFRHRKMIRKDNEPGLLLFIFIAVTLSLTINIIWYQNLTAHRYFIPVYLSFALMACYLLFHLRHEKIKKVLATIWILGLVTGNLWVYPEKIAQGWDSTLAHLPYYELKNKMLAYMEENNIPMSKTGSSFPDLAPMKYMYLNNDNRSFCQLDLSENQYVYYSNFHNDFSDSQIDILKEKWILLREYSKGGVFVSLYKNPGKKCHP